MDADVSREVQKYVIAYFGGGSRAKRPCKYRAIISLYSSTGLFAALYFYDDADDLPDTDKLDGERILSVHFQIGDMPNVLDILRNEPPVYFHQIAKWPTMGVVSTNEELEVEYLMLSP